MKKTVCMEEFIKLENKVNKLSELLRLAHSNSQEVKKLEERVKSLEDINALNSGEFSLLDTSDDQRDLAIESNKEKVLGL